MTRNPDERVEESSVSRMPIGAKLARAMVVLAVASASACGQGTETGAAPAGAPPFPPTAAKLTKLRSLADTAARQNGVDNPSDVRVFATTRDRALMALRGSSSGGDEPVYVVTMRGDFVSELAPRPPDAPAPRGEMLSLLVDPASDLVVVGALNNSVRDLAPLGESIRLDS